MSNDILNIAGWGRLDALMASLPANIAANILPKALAAGAEVIAAEVRQTAPVGPPASENAQLYGGYAGALRDSVRVSTGIGKGGRALASVKVGGKGRKGADVFYAHMVEFGTAAHLIVPKRAQALAIGGAVVAAVHHPGAHAQPFVRPAFDSKAAAAVEAVGAYIRTSLASERPAMPALEGE